MPKQLHTSGVHQKEVKWLYVQGASGKTITGELRETIVDRISFLDKEASGQSTRESKRKNTRARRNI